MDQSGADEGVRALSALEANLTVRHRWVSGARDVGKSLDAWHFPSVKLNPVTAMDPDVQTARSRAVNESVAVAGAEVAARLRSEIQGLVVALLRASSA
jgi:hypothetical protein